MPILVPSVVPAERGVQNVGIYQHHPVPVVIGWNIHFQVESINHLLVLVQFLYRVLQYFLKVPGLEGETQQDSPKGV